LLEYSCEQKDSAVKELLLREKTAKEIADDIGVDKVTLYYDDCASQCAKIRAYHIVGGIPTKKV